MGKMLVDKMSKKASVAPSVGLIKADLTALKLLFIVKKQVEKHVVMTEDSSSYNHDGWTRENHTLNFRKKGCKAVIVVYYLRWGTQRQCYYLLLKSIFRERLRKCHFVKSSFVRLFFVCFLQLELFCHTCGGMAFEYGVVHK